MERNTYMIEENVFIDKFKTKLKGTMGAPINM